MDTHITPWTAKELSAEWAHIYHTRVGLLIGAGTLTLSADYMAQQEADEAIKRLSLPTTGPDAPVKRVSAEIISAAILKESRQ